MRKPIGTATVLPPQSKDGVTPTTTFDDGKFLRTAILLDTKDRESGSIDVVTLVEGKLVRLAQINIFHLDKRENAGEECVMIDVIDIDDKFTERRVVLPSRRGTKHVALNKSGNVVGAHFARKG